MPTAVSPNPRAGSAQPDELDKLLDYDNAVDDFMRDIGVDNNDQSNANTTEQRAQEEDQEVQVKKKRRPNPKLDENRLLSQEGIPKLRKITKTRLKFRGKGHEFADISRLLNTYQLWLDDLYPRAKFRDALSMVEKVGHSKRMQVMRRAWLDDTKPGRRGNSPDVEMSGALGDGHVGDGGDQPSAEDLFGQMLREDAAHDDATSRGAEQDAPDDDELDALLAENGDSHSAQPQKTQPKRTGPFEEDEPDDDELDALMAETAGNDSTNPSGERTEQRRHVQDDPEDDELDALLMAEQASAEPNDRRFETTGGAKPSERDEFEDEEEVMASMGGMW